MGLDEFWRLTPSELSALEDAYVWRERERARGDVTHAWLCAAFERTRRLRPLREYIEDLVPDGAPRPRQQSPQETLAVCQQLAAQFGIPMREREAPDGQ